MKKLIYTLVLLLVLSITAPAQWVLKPGTGNTSSLVNQPGKIFAGGAVIGHIGIFVSTNNGTNWTPSGLDGILVNSLITSGNYIFAGTYGYSDGGVYSSINNGASWNLTGLVGNFNIVSLAISGSNIYAGNYAGSSGDSIGVYKSSNNGASWIRAFRSKQVKTLLATGTNIFVGTQDSGIYLSTNNGTNWVKRNNGLNNTYIISLTVSGINIFAGTGNGMFKSTDNGLNWIPCGLVNELTYSFIVWGSNIFAGTSQGVYLSTNNGSSWIKKPGLYMGDVKSFTIANDSIFAATDVGVWRRGLTEIVSIKQISTEIPSKYSLSQNFPNPFNPSTKINFTITKSGLVTLKVYDIKGKDIVTLINENQSPGTYSVDFNSSNLTSGIYFYRLQTGNYTETKRMLLVK